MKALAGLSIAAMGALLGSTAYAQNFENMYFLGDSLTDCCVLGPFTQNRTPNFTAELPGLIGAENFASASTNLAVGGAQSGIGNVAPPVDRLLGKTTGLLSQVAELTGSGLAFSPRDIVSIWIGTNDIQSAGLTPAEAAKVGYYQPIGSRPSTEALVEYTTGNLRTAVDSLTSQGLRNILLITPADLTETIEVRFGSPESAQIEGVYSLAMRDAFANFYTPGVNTYFLDTYSLVKNVQQNPGAYGFVSTTPSNNCQVNNCTALSLEQQEQYVYYDPIHYTSGFQSLIAEYSANIINSRDGLPAQGDLGQAAGTVFSNVLLNRLDGYYRRASAPGDFSFPTKAVPGSAPLSRTSRVSFFIEAVNAGVDRTSAPTEYGPEDPGFNASFYGVTAGLEYQITPTLLVGIAANYLTTDTDPLGLSRTSYDLESFQGGVYASYDTGTWFADGALTYGSNNYDLSRPGVIDTLTASPDGTTLTIGGKAGYLFDVNRVRLGPIAEFLYTNTDMDSYQENGDSLLALGVNSQSFDSFSAGAGVQLRADLPALTKVLSLYVNLTAQHDFIDNSRTITSYGVEAPALLINTGAGQGGDDLYGKVTGGASIEFGNGFAGLISGGATFGRDYGNDYLVNAEIRYRF